MHFYLLFAALSAHYALAFPWMTPEGMDNLLNHPEARQEINRRLQELDNRAPEETQRHEARLLGTGGLLGGIGDLVGGTVDAVLDNVLGLIPTVKVVKGLKRFPEGKSTTVLPPDNFLMLCANYVSANHPFQAPGPTDQRGPCPGLNTLANHGYIPRSGIATIGQINAATAEVFNMGADLSTLLTVGGVVTGGDILTQQVSIGGPDARVGLQGALGGIFGTPSGIAGHGTKNPASVPSGRAMYLADINQGSKGTPRPRATTCTWAATAPPSSPSSSNSCTSRPSRGATAPTAWPP